MANKVNIGDNTFNATNQGTLKTYQPESVKRQTRLTAAGSNDAMISLGVTLVTFNVPILSGARIINIQNIIATCDFVDAGLGTYNVANKVRVYIERAQILNLDSQALPYFQNHTNLPLNVVCNIDVSNTLLVYFIISGGDVAAETGITPAAGDTVSSSITIVYEPL